MRWRRKTDPEVPREHEDARKALHKAERDLNEAQDRNTEIIHVAEKAKAYGRRNNFTEMISQALHGTGS